VTGGNFADRLMDAMRRKKSQVAVGLDPRLDRMPRRLVREAMERHGSTPTGAAQAIVAFNRAVIDAVAPHAVAVKCQVAFYERFGCEGMRAYAQALVDARERGLIVIGDVKRSDIASTVQAYAEAHLGGDAPAAPDFVADAVTVNPLLGSDGVLPFLEAASARGGGVFVLVRTSNPSSAELQELSCDGRRLWERLAGMVAEWGLPYVGRSGYSALGAVVGATFPRELAALRGLMARTPLLVPGFGAQGGGVVDVAGAFDRDGLGALVSSSRGIIYAWEREPFRGRFGEERWQDAVGEAAAEMRRQLWQATH